MKAAATDAPSVEIVHLDVPEAAFNPIAARVAKALAALDLVLKAVPGLPFQIETAEEDPVAAHRNIKRVAPDGITIAARIAGRNMPAKSVLLSRQHR